MKEVLSILLEYVIAYILVFIIYYFIFVRKKTKYNKNKVQAWEKHHFDMMFVGSDWQGTPAWELYEKQFFPFP